MFTGIVECTGTVLSSRGTSAGLRLAVDAGSVADGIQPGASVCVDGVCLTVTERSDCRLEFDVTRETLDRSTLGRLRAGNRVNLERSLRAGDRIDGHFVQGHVDGLARIIRRQTGDEGDVLWLEPPEELRPYLIPKGSVALAGISLTIAALRDGQFSVALIPTTLERTTLGRVKVGDELNVETDVLVRAVVHTLRQTAGTSAQHFGALSEAKLREYGYL